MDEEDASGGRLWKDQNYSKQRAEGLGPGAGDWGLGTALGTALGTWRGALGTVQPVGST